MTGVVLCPALRVKTSDDGLWHLSVKVSKTRAPETNFKEMMEALESLTKYKLNVILASQECQRLTL